MNPTETPSALLRRAADRLDGGSPGVADLSLEHPDLEAVTASLLRQQAYLVDLGGSMADTPRALQEARHILGEA